MVTDFNEKAFLNKWLLFLMQLHYLLHFTQLKKSTVVSNAFQLMHMNSLFLKGNQSITFVLKLKMKNPSVTIL